jgi:hypothetical protein
MIIYKAAGPRTDSTVRRGATERGLRLMHLDEAPPNIIKYYKQGRVRIEPIAVSYVTNH